MLVLVSGRGRLSRIRNISTSKQHRCSAAPKILSFRFLNKCVNMHNDKCLSKKFQNTGTETGNSARKLPYSQRCVRIRCELTQREHQRISWYVTYGMLTQERYPQKTDSSFSGYSRLCEYEQKYFKRLTLYDSLLQITVIKRTINSSASQLVTKI